MIRRVVGCMTGTSIDGIDAALVEIDGTGLAMKPTFLRGVSRDLGPVRDPLRCLAEQQPMTAGDIAGAMHAFAHVHIDAIRDLLKGEACDLICVHGQTVFHRPPASWQLMQPAPIAREFGVPVVFDLRAMDLAAGGQGAPITPIADWVLFRSSVNTAIVNLGGFCNITFLPAGCTPSEVRGMDVCPCNNLLDAIARRLMGMPFDADGARAASGTVHDEALEDLEGILASMRGRSLGTGDETGEWISRWRAHVSPENLAATACEAIAARIGSATPESSELYLAGGGARHRTLASAIASAATATVKPAASQNIPGEYREAVCFAILGALCQDRIPITLPQVTNAPSPAPLSGAWIMP
jgi:1,6-anhydro-N-acetylmuramate kinase